MSFLKSPRSRLAILLAFGLCLSMGAGCDRTKQTVQSTGEQDSKGDAVHYVSASSSPRAILDECASSYRRLESYEDKAYVELKYRIGEKWHQDRAPLHVAWSSGSAVGQNHELLGLRVYSTVAGPDGDRWRARIDRHDLAESNQVVSRAIPKRVDFPWLLDDGVIAQSLSAGLAGFPPQLDLLLSSTPLSGLVNDAAQLRRLRPASLNDRLCHVIQVDVAGRSYQLWIDQASMLLRRLVMPEQNIPHELLATQGVEDVQLSVELASIRVGETIDWANYRVDVEAQDYLVSHFVAPPAQWDTGGLGVQVPAFRLKDGQGVSVFEVGRNNRASEPDIKVLVWLANHPSSQLAAEQVAMVADLLEGDPDLDGRVRFVPIWAEPVPPAGMSFEELRESWELPGKVAVDTEAVGRDLFQVEEAPTLVVLDRDNRIQLRETSGNPMLAQFLPKILRRLSQGVDIAAEFIEDARNVSRRSVAELQAALAIDNQRTLRSDAADGYWPQWVEVIRSNSQQFETTLVTTCLDETGHVWTLTQDGDLTKWATVGREISRRKTWTAVGTPRPDSRLKVDASVGLVALVNLETTGLKVLDTRNGHQFDVSIGAEDAVVDLQWMSVESDARPRLAVTTKDDWLLLIDPENQEQLSARCPSSPVALLPRPLGTAGVGGLVVLEDRTVQPIQLGEQETQPTLSLNGVQDRELGDGSAMADEVLLTGYRIPVGSGTGNSRVDLASTVSNTNATDQLLEALPFQPAVGGWQRLASEKHAFTLGRGWLAKDEPAAFLLDSNLAPIWHRRLPLLGQTGVMRQVSGSVDPRSGQPVWTLLDADQTVHLFRADGLADHFRFREPTLHVALMTAGSELNLCAAFADRIELYRLVWR